MGQVLLAAEWRLDRERGGQRQRRLPGRLREAGAMVGVARSGVERTGLL